MSAAVRPTPRRMGWTPLPVRCPACRKKMGDAVLLTYGGLRCPNPACAAVIYLLVYLPLGLAFVAETSAHELIRLGERELNALDTLAYFGATFPYLT